MRKALALTGIAVVAALLSGCGDSTGPDTIDDGEWRGVVTPGNMIEIKGVNGDISASAVSGTEVVVSWTKSANDSDPSEVSVQVLVHDDGVTICAVYPDVPGQPANECGPGLAGQMSTRDNDVEVNFTLGVPAGVEFVGRSVTGSVSATDLTDNVFGFTVTGDVNITTAGLAEAMTVTGSVNAVIGLTDWDRDLDFTTVTGNVTVRVRANTNAEVRASTVSGSITSDFPLMGTTPGTQQGTIGSGGPRLTLTTVTGNITLRRGS